METRGIREPTWTEVLWREIRTVVIEGMIISGAYAVGAHEGYIYVRNEFPLAVTHLSLAIETAREKMGSWEKTF
jgi:NADH:ubiquinone oxidoreductase subunit F (NADH-binding)